MELNQYEIVLANLDPTLGSEIKKTKHCVIISPNEMNSNVRTIVIAPLTTQARQYPTRVEIFHNQLNGWVILDQIRAIDKSRVIKVLGKLSTKEIVNVKSILKRTYVD